MWREILSRKYEHIFLPFFTGGLSTEVTQTGLVLPFTFYSVQCIVLRLWPGHRNLVYIYILICQSYVLSDEEDPTHDHGAHPFLLHMSDWLRSILPGQVTHSSNSVNML